MTRGELEEALRHWGGYYREGRPPLEDRSLTGNSSLSQFGRPAGATAYHDRRCVSRRLLMAAGSPGHRVAPAWSCDPIRAVQSRVYREHGRDDPNDTGDVQRVQAAWIALQRVQSDQAQALRCEYQLRARDQHGRCGAAGEAIGRVLIIWQYRYLLKCGREWMLGRLK